MKYLSLAALTIAACIWVTGCKEREEKFVNPYLDYSLAGSAALSTTRIRVQVLHNGIPLDSSACRGKHLQIMKLSDTEISLHCDIAYNDKNLRIRIPRMPVSGKPYDVTFDYSPHDTEAIYDCFTYYPTSANASGRITEPFLAGMRSSPYIPDHRFDIKMDFGFADGTQLDVRVTPDKRKKPAPAL